MRKFTAEPRPKLGQWTADDGTETTLFVEDLMEEVRELQRDACANFSALDGASKLDADLLVDLQLHRARCKACIGFDSVVDKLALMAVEDQTRVKEWRAKRRRT